MSNQRLFRLFISSTFSDFTAEREVLQSKVFPAIKKYCRELGGFSFQPIDLRWGVTQEAQLDQKTLELCLNEVQSCKKYPAPNFLILAGDRYGWIPLPYAIEKEEFEILVQYMSDGERIQVLEWYKEDLNQIPISYILQERDGKYVDFNAWSDLETKLRNIIQIAVKKSGIPEDISRKYFLSATEAEVFEGILEYGKEHSEYQKYLISSGLINPELDRQNVFALIRHIKGDISSTLFGDEHHREALLFKKAVKDEIDEYLEVETRLVSKQDLNTTYLHEFEESVIKFLKIRLEQFAAQLEELSELEIEIEQHSDYAYQKTRHFQGREQSRKIISDYISGNKTEIIKSPQSPLILYGPSGGGKSSLMAKAADEALSFQSEVIQRYIGATPSSSKSVQILLSILEEMGIKSDDIRENFSLKEQLSDRKLDFDDFCYEVRSRLLRLKTNINTKIIFIDAIDQLEHDDELLWLPDILPDHLKIVISLLNDENYPEDSKYYDKVKNRKMNFHQIPPMENPLNLMHTLLKSYHRTLQDYQKEYFLRQYNSSRSPLFITLAVQELRHWKSNDRVEPEDIPGGSGTIQDLADNQRDLIKEFISNLYSFYHHDKYFVQIVLGYIYVSRDGLSESELLQLISVDPELVQKFAPETWHKNPTGELPTVIWSRLYAQIKTLLKVSLQDGEELLYFFHREFSTVVAEQEGQKDIHRRIITSCQKLIEKHQNEGFDKSRWGKLYITLVSEYELRYKDENYLKENANYISKLDNEDYIQEIIDLIISIGDGYYVTEKINEAITFYKLGSSIITPLYEKDPVRWVDKYTIFIRYLVYSYRKINRLDDAITINMESIEILIPLYDQNPVRWAEAYATSLTQLSCSYRDINLIDESIILEKQSYEILKLLYEHNPDNYVISYTSSLSNRALLYKKLNRKDDAISLEKECVEILKPLYEQNPDWWTEHYTVFLNNLAVSYMDSNRNDDAIKMSKESLKIIKPLYEKNPDRLVDLYTTYLNNLANAYKKINRLDDAIKMNKECVEILKPLYEKNPDRWARSYTNTLNNFADFYKMIGKCEEFIESYEVSSLIQKPLYEQDPPLWVESYTNTLNNLALLYKRIKRFDDAIKTNKECIEIRKAFYELDKRAWAESYIITLNNLADCYEDINKLDDAITMYMEGLVIRKALYEQDPVNFSEPYIVNLITIADLHYDLNNTDDAFVLYEESIKILKTLFIEDPEKWIDEYTIFLKDLGIAYRGLGNYDKAVIYLKNAMELSIKHYGREDSKTAIYYSALGWNYHLMGEKQNAMDLLEKCYNTRCRLFGEDDESSISVLQRLEEVKSS